MPRPLTRTEYLEFQRAVLDINTPTPEGRRDAGQYDDIYPDQRILATRGRWKEPQDVPPPVDLCAISDTSVILYLNGVESMSGVEPLIDPLVTEAHIQIVDSLLNLGVDVDNDLSGTYLVNSRLTGVSGTPDLEDFVLDFSAVMDIGSLLGATFRTNLWVNLNDTYCDGVVMSTGYMYSLRLARTNAGLEVGVNRGREISIVANDCEGDSTEFFVPSVTIPRDPVNPDGMWHVRLKVFGNRFIVCIDGDVVLDINDDRAIPGDLGEETLVSGGFGFYHDAGAESGFAGEAYVDEIIIYTYDGSDL